MDGFIFIVPGRLAITAQFLSRPHNLQTSIASIHYDYFMYIAISPLDIMQHLMSRVSKTNVGLKYKTKPLKYFANYKILLNFTIAWWPLTSHVNNNLWPLMWTTTSADEVTTISAKHQLLIAGNQIRQRTASQRSSSNGAWIRFKNGVEVFG